MLFPALSAEHQLLRISHWHASNSTLSLTLTICQAHKQTPVNQFDAIFYLLDCITSINICFVIIFPWCWPLSGLALLWVLLVLIISKWDTLRYTISCKWDCCLHGIDWTCPVLCLMCILQLEGQCYQPSSKPQTAGEVGSIQSSNVRDVQGWVLTPRDLEAPADSYVAMDWSFRSLYSSMTLFLTFKYPGSIFETSPRVKERAPLIFCKMM